MNLQVIISTVFSAIFLVVLASYYVLLFKKKRIPKGTDKFSSITIILPAHNEERYIADCIRSVLDADFPGEKEVIVVDDGSSDKTFMIAKKFPVKVLKSKHKGKAKSINQAVKVAGGELVAVVDADGVVHKDSFTEALDLMSDRKVGVVCSTVKVKNRHTFLGMWLHIEQLYNSLLRSFFTKVNVNIVAPGPLSIYKKHVIEELGGFSAEGFSEDVDIAVRTIKAGYTVEHAEKSVSETNMPLEPKWFWKQRTRFARGWINIFKKHLELNRSFIEIYTLPLALFWYFQAVIMSAIMIYNIVRGFITYFASQGVWFNYEVLKYFINWLSMAGVFNWIASIISGDISLTLAEVIGLAATLLSYPLYFIAILKYDRKLTLWHLFPVFFMFPFWLMLMVVYTIGLKEFFAREQRNIWPKRVIGG